MGKAAVGLTLLFGAKLYQGGQGASSRSICSVLLPSLAPGWGWGLSLAWAKLQVSLWGYRG